MKKVVCFIQTRLASSRLPAKCMLNMNGMTVLDYIINRIAYSKRVLYIVVSTGSDPQNDVIESSIQTNCGLHRILARVHRGSDNDLIDRHLSCLEDTGKKEFIRVQADNVFVSPQYIDELIKFAKENDLDYASYWCPITMRSAMETHSGFWAEYITAKALKNARQIKGTDALVFDSPKIKSDYIKMPFDTRHVRLTLDTLQDYINIQKILKMVSMTLLVDVEYISKRLLSNACGDLRKSMRNLMITNKKGE